MGEPKEEDSFDFSLAARAVWIRMLLCITGSERTKSYYLHETQELVRRSVSEDLARKQ